MIASGLTRASYEYKMHSRSRSRHTYTASLLSPHSSGVIMPGFRLTTLHTSFSPISLHFFPTNWCHFIDISPSRSETNQRGCLWLKETGRPDLSWARCVLIGCRLDCMRSSWLGADLKPVHVRCHNSKPPIVAPIPGRDRT